MICRLNQAHDWPEQGFVAKCHTHDLEKLVDLAGLKPAWEEDSDKDPLLKKNWTIAKDWNERSRYERRTELEARKLIDAIIDPTHGVLSWIKAHW